MARKNSLATFGVLGGLIVIIIGLHQIGWLSWLESGVLRAFNPIGAGLHRIGGWFQPDPIDGVPRQDLIAELESVKEQNDKLLTENARLLGIEAENETLRRYLSFFRENQFEYHMAAVVAQGSAGDSWRNRESLLLNRGSADGLVVGLPIVSPEGILLGKLTKVETNTSEACLLYSEACRIAVSLAGEAGTVGVSQGDLGLTVNIDFIPQNREIKAGALVVTSGLEEGMPPDLVVGHISRIINQNNELWQKALLEPSGDFKDLDAVAVIK